MQNITTRLPLSRIKYLTVILFLAGTIAVIFFVGISCSINPVSSEKEQVTMDILANSIAYLKTYHPDAAAFLGDDISFTKSSSAKGKLGYTGVTYKGGGWTFAIGRAVTPEAPYDIRAEYGDGEIVWVGLSENEQIKEESYTKR